MADLDEMIADAQKRAALRAALCAAAADKPPPWTIGQVALTAAVVVVVVLLLPLALAMRAWDAAAAFLARRFTTS